jgi:hypothetical protein
MYIIMAHTFLWTGPLIGVEGGEVPALTLVAIPILVVALLAVERHSN